MAFDRWSVYGTRFNNQDRMFVNILDHHISGLGTKFSKDIILELKTNGKTQLESAFNDKNIVNIQDKIDKPAKQYLKKINKLAWLNNPKNIDIEYWGGFFAHEAYNFNFITHALDYRINFTNYLRLSDLTIYAYIFNLDNMMFEVYSGFNDKLGNGRYAKNKHPFIETHHYGVNLEYELPIEQLITFYDQNNGENWDLNLYAPDVWDFE